MNANSEAVEKPRKPRRAEARGLARLLAVQALYQMDLSGTDARDVLSDFQWRKRIDGPTDYDPDHADADFLEKLVLGVVAEQQAVDRLIAEFLPEPWPLGRLDSTLRAIFRAAGYELHAFDDIPPAVIISQYLDVAHAFFSTEEPALLNAVLERMARHERGSDWGRGSGTPLKG